MIDPSMVTTAAAVYVLMLLGLGVFGRRAMRDPSLQEFYLAGRSIGLLVLLLTLFATQYSGNSLSGFPGKTYRSGLSYIMSVGFMVAIVSGYLLFAPRLVALARRKRFLTPTDYLRDRFGSPLLCYTSAVIFALTLCNFLLAQLMAMGHSLAGLTDGRIPYWAGVAGGALVILIYECLGGMRAVAWTDAVQGVVLLLGLGLVAVLIFREIGSPAEIVAMVAARTPEKIANPSLQTCFAWLSSFLLLGLGAPLYPQAIQRLYAARRLRELRLALGTMAVVPLFAITTVVLVGLTGLALFDDLGTVGSDQVTFRVLAHLVELEPRAAIPVLVVLMAVLAAIMSTADSALLSLSSILTKDFAAPALRLDESGTERLARYAPLSSLLILLVIGSVAMVPRFTLWRLLEIKFEILIQLSPAFVFGTLHDRDHPGRYLAVDIGRGLAAGLGIALVFFAVGVKSLGGFHPGVLGVLVNYVVAFTSRALRLRSSGRELEAPPPGAPA